MNLWHRSSVRGGSSAGGWEQAASVPLLVTCPSLATLLCPELDLTDPGLFQGALEHWAVVPEMLLVALEGRVPILCVCVSPQAGHNFHNADMSYVKKLCGTFLGGPKLPER